MSNTSNLKQEISQLCQLILLFQKHVEDDRQQLFNNQAMTDDKIWNYAFGGNVRRIGKDQLYIFMHKHHSPQSKENCEQICQRYSSSRDGFITKQDFWEIFKPKKLVMMDSILKMKRAKSNLPKLLAISSKIIKCIVNILEKTVQYQKNAEKMKKNLYRFKDQFGNFSLKKIQPKYLQSYLVEYLSEIRIKDCQIILSHIIGSKLNEQKYFYTFFLPIKYKEPKVNPLKEHDFNTQEKSHQTLQFFYKSDNIWKYGKNYKNHSKPLYLI